jgi:cardiolipin synthase
MTMNNESTYPSDVSMFDGLLTIPNAITLVRLLCLPIFLWVLFGLDNRHAAAWLLGSVAATDWVDGFLARRLNQTSEFGKIFDPTVDRLLFFVGIIALIIDGSAPLWFALIVLIREILVAAMMLVGTFVFNMKRFDVTWWGKTAAFLLMLTFPGFLMGESGMPIASAFTVVSWILGIPGIVLSVYTACAYVPLVVDGIRSGRQRA